LIEPIDSIVVFEGLISGNFEAQPIQMSNPTFSPSDLIGQSENQTRVCLKILDGPNVHLLEPAQRVFFSANIPDITL
jgi:hypothetical protein